MVGVSFAGNGELRGSLGDVSRDGHDASVALAALEGPHAGFELDAQAVAARDAKADEGFGAGREDLLKSGQELISICRGDDLEEASADDARGGTAEDRQHRVADVDDAAVCAELDDQVSGVPNQLGLSAFLLASLGWHRVDPGMSARRAGRGPLLSEMNPI